MNKMGMLQNKNIVFGDLTLFDLTLTRPWPQVKPDVKMNVSI